MSSKNWPLESAADCYHSFMGPVWLSLMCFLLGAGSDKATDCGFVVFCLLSVAPVVVSDGESGDRLSGSWGRDRFLGLKDIRSLGLLIPTEADTGMSDGIVGHEDCDANTG